MVKCHRCKLEIEGNTKSRSIFIPPSIVIPQAFCESCWEITQQKERETLPYVFLILIAILMIPLLYFLLNG